jgi:D-glycero-alpha-D-manno-heptose-7-phosphate kinase
MIRGMESISSVLTIAPLRLSFVGGGSDIPTFYRKHEGAVVSAAINKFVYVHIKRHDDSFQERYRIAYSEIEHTNSRRNIKNQIIQKCLEYLDMDLPLQINTSSDLPAGSGLGSSSSFCVALLLALHTLRGEAPTKYQLASEACEIEIDLLRKPIGKQDQFAASFGGLNLFHFLPNEKVRVEPIVASTELIEGLEIRSRIFWTGINRNADDVLQEQGDKHEDNEEAIKKLAFMALEFRDELESEKINWQNLSDIIRNSWQIKRKLASGIENAVTAKLLHRVQAHFGDGVKLLGAGGGGFVYSLTTNVEQVKEFEQPFVSPRIDFNGARVISQI